MAPLRFATLRALARLVRDSSANDRVLELHDQVQERPGLLAERLEEVRDSGEFRISFAQVLVRDEAAHRRLLSEEKTKRGARNGHRVWRGHAINGHASSAAARDPGAAAPRARPDAR